MRGSEVDLLERAAQYRVTFTEDLKQDSGDVSRFTNDLRSLKDQGLIAERTVTHLREGIVADVVSVTPEGKALLDDHRHTEHDSGQAYSAAGSNPPRSGMTRACFVWCARSRRSSNSRGVTSGGSSWMTN